MLGLISDIFWQMKMIILSLVLYVKVKIIVFAFVLASNVVISQKNLICVDLLHDSRIKMKIEVILLTRVTEIPYT
jgi:hypothetical protein